MGTVHIPTLLEGILEATAAEAAAKARIATLRAALEDEARRRFAAEGAAPSWTTPQLGKVRLDPPSEWAATVADPAAFGSFVAEHYPTEATAIVPIPAADLADALQALEFIGVKPAGEVRVEVRSAWEEPYVAGLAVDVEETELEDGAVDRTITVVDPATGQLVDGMTATRKPAKLVVSLDRDRRTAAVTQAQATAAALLEAASEDEAPGPDLDELHARRIELEGLHATTLTTIAKAHDLGSSGTKAELAERIARAELATGNVIRPASTIETPEPLPDDVEVEEVTTLPVDQPVEEVPDAGTVAEAEEEVCGYSFDHDTTGANPYECRRCGAELEQPDDEPERVVILDEAVVDEVREALATTEGAEGPHVDELTARRRQLLDGLSREVLRGYAKSVGISAAGTKGDLLDRLVEAGATVTQVNEWARAARA